jgi:hypothetical protein
VTGIAKAIAATPINGAERWVAVLIRVGFTLAANATVKYALREMRAQAFGAKPHSKRVSSPMRRTGQ